MLKNKKQSIYKTDSGKMSIIKYYESLLKTWPKSYKSFHISTKYGFTYILENGNIGKPVIVLLHGSGSNAAMWKGEAEKYVKDYHVYAIDIIGECGKSAPTRPNFTDGNYATWLKEVFEQLQIEKAILIGCSLGGWIALDFSINFPNKVEKLVLIATAGITQLKVKTILWIMATSLFGSWGFNKINKMVYGGVEMDPKATEFALLIKEHFVPRTVVLPVFSNEQLRDIACPVFFIGGENDCFYPSEKTALRLKEQTKFSKTLVLKDTGHIVQNQSAAITLFLNQ